MEYKVEFGYLTSRRLVVFGHTTLLLVHLKKSHEMMQLG